MEVHPRYIYIHTYIYISPPLSPSDGPTHLPPAPRKGSPAGGPGPGVISARGTASDGRGCPPPGTGAGARGEARPWGEEKIDPLAEDSPVGGGKLTSWRGKLTSWRGIRQLAATGGPKFPSPTFVKKMVNSEAHLLWEKDRARTGYIQTT